MSHSVGAPARHGAAGCQGHGRAACRVRGPSLAGRSVQPVDLAGVHVVNAALDGRALDDAAHRRKEGRAQSVQEGAQEGLQDGRQRPACSNLCWQPGQGKAHHTASASRAPCPSSQRRLLQQLHVVPHALLQIREGVIVRVVVMACRSRSTGGASHRPGEGAAPAAACSLPPLPPALGSLPLPFLAPPPPPAHPVCPSQSAAAGAW